MYDSKILIDEKLKAGSGFGQIIRRDSGFGIIHRTMNLFTYAITITIELIMYAVCTSFKSV